MYSICIYRCVYIYIYILHTSSLQLINMIYIYIHNNDPSLNPVRWRWASLDAGARGWIRRQKHRRRGVLRRGQGHGEAEGIAWILRIRPGGQWNMLGKTGEKLNNVLLHYHILPFITGKSSISIYFYLPLWSMFNSYVKLPEGNWTCCYLLGFPYES